MASKPSTQRAASQVQGRAPDAPAIDEPKNPAPVSKSRAGAKVTVACKLPHGLLLRTFEMGSRMIPAGPIGVVKIEQAVVRGEPVRINGTAVPFGKIPNFIITPSGYALTAGVDKDFFDLWLAQNKDSDVVSKGLVFAHESNDHVRGMAEDRKDFRSGLEPLDPNGDKRVPKGSSANLSGIQQDDEQVKRRAAAAA